MDPNSFLEKPALEDVPRHTIKSKRSLTSEESQKIKMLETTNLKFLRFLNVFSLLAFMILYCLTYIFVGFNHHFLLLQVEAAALSLYNLSYANISHRQKLRLSDYILLTIYLPCIFSFGVCGLFSFLAIEDTENTSDQDAEYRGKWMLTFITLYLAVIATYILNAREFKIVYIDNAPEEESSDEDDDIKTHLSDSSSSSQRTNSLDSEEIDEEIEGYNKNDYFKHSDEPIRANFGINRDSFSSTGSSQRKRDKERTEVIYLS